MQREQVRDACRASNPELNSGRENGFRGMRASPDKALLGARCAASLPGDAERKAGAAKGQILDEAARLELVVEVPIRRENLDGT